MPRYRATILVPNPVAEAFAFVSDFRNAARWDPRVAGAAKVTEGPVRTGTRFLLASRMLGKELALPYEVRELEPERRLVLAGRTRLLRYRDEITFEAAGGDGAGGTRLTYDAHLALRGILALGNPLLGLVFDRIGDDAVAGIGRALAAEEARRRENARDDGAPAMARELTPEAVRRIVAMDDRPVLRNLLITQGYHQLSRQLAGFVGGEDANWCTYAAWASKTAGTFIREEELSAELRRFLVGKRRLRRRLRRLHRALHAFHPDAAPAGGDDLGPILGVTREIGRFIEAGNREVFAELGGLFAEMLAELGGDDQPDQARFDAFLGRLRPGESRPDRLERRGDEIAVHAEGGQDLLRGTARAYYAARFEGDPRRKAELVLLGNALGGLHEQTRLQAYILGALEAPVAELVFSRENDALKERLARHLLGPAQEALHRMFTPVGEELTLRVRELTTLLLTRMAVPGDVLALGEDLPAPLGRSLYPELLDPLGDPELVRTLGRFGAYPLTGRGLPLPARLRRLLVLLLVRIRLRRPVAVGSAARDWAELSDRMRYIFVYFRSRQREESLFEAPFEPEQAADLLAGRVPGGAL